MINLDSAAGDPPAGMALFTAADLQDHLLVASNDLERLQRLLDDAGQALMGHFTGASARLAAVMSEIDSETLTSDALETLSDTQQTLGGAITAMQFQDMATQLIAHNHPEAAQLRRPAGPGGDGRRRGRRDRRRRSAAAPESRDPGRDGRGLHRVVLTPRPTRPPEL